MAVTGVYTSWSGYLGWNHVTDLNVRDRWQTPFTPHVMCDVSMVRVLYHSYDLLWVKVSEMCDYYYLIVTVSEMCNYSLLLVTVSEVCNYSWLVVQAKSDYNFENYKEENIALKRQEAKEICKQFRQLCPMGLLLLLYFSMKPVFLIVEKAF